MAATCAKILIVIVNIIFLLFGLGFLVGGIFIRVGEKYYQPQLDKFQDEIPDIAAGAGETGVEDDGDSNESLDIGGILMNIAIVLIVFGLFMTITAILGMCGACCTNKCMLVMYIIIVGVIFLAQFAVLIILITGMFEDRVKDKAKDIIKNDYAGIADFSVESLSLNYIMIDYECCGVDDYEDFDDAKKWNATRSLTFSGSTAYFDLETPIACCKTEGNFPKVTIANETCAIEATDGNNNWKEGCWDAIEDDIEDRKLYFYILFGIILAFEFFCILLATCIMCKANKDKIILLKQTYFNRPLDAEQETTRTSKCFDIGCALKLPSDINIILNFVSYDLTCFQRFSRNHKITNTRGPFHGSRDIPRTYTKVGN